jgi:hypothetical protein
MESALSSRRQNDRSQEINFSGFNASATNTSYITQVKQAETPLMDYNVNLPLKQSFAQNTRSSHSSGVVDYSAAWSGSTASLQRQQLTANVADEARGTSVNEMASRQPQSIDQTTMPLQSATSVKLPFPTIKLGTYSGASSFETFLAKFNNTASYLGCTELDRLSHLCSCFEGAADQVPGTKDRNGRLRMKFACCRRGSVTNFRPNASRSNYECNDVTPAKRYNSCFKTYAIWLH